jgi:hypothetical protein
MIEAELNPDAKIRARLARRRMLIRLVLLPFVGAAAAGGLVYHLNSLEPIPLSWLQAAGVGFLFSLLPHLLILARLIELHSEKWFRRRQRRRAQATRA